MFCITGNGLKLTICMTTRTVPETDHVQELAERNLLEHLSSVEGITSLSNSLSETLDTPINLTNGRIGSIKVDAILEDLSSLEYIKELSDTWVLSNIMDSILMTPEFIESCQAEDVSLLAVLDEESYQRIKNLPGEYNMDIFGLCFVLRTTGISVCGCLMSGWIFS